MRVVNLLLELAIQRDEFLEHWKFIQVLLFEKTARLSLGESWTVRVKNQGDGHTFARLRRTSSDNSARRTFTEIERMARFASQQRQILLSTRHRE